MGILVCLAIFIMLEFITAIVAFNMAFSRNPIKIPFLAKAGFSAQQWEELRSRIDVEISEIKQLPSEEWEIVSYDGLKLKATFIPHKNAKRTILCVHGYRSSGYFNFSMAVKSFIDNDCNLLIIDQRSHGRSEGKIITFGIKERFDVCSWADCITQKLGEELPIYLDGVSMGASTVLMASALELNTNVKGVIADCGYTSCYDIIYKIVKEDFHINPILILPALNVVFKIRTGYFMNGVKVYEEIKRNVRPVLFAHGKADNFVPYEMTLKNYNACNRAKNLVLSEQAEHGMAFIKSREEYLNKLSDMFKECEK